MSVLRDKAGLCQLVLKPYRVERGEAEWVLTQLELKSPTEAFVSTTFSLLRKDLDEMRRALVEAAEGSRPARRLTSSDENFILEIEPADSEADLFIAFWIGEPYQLMRGFRFVVSATDVKRFAAELELDQASVAPPAQLP